MIMVLLYDSGRGTHTVTPVGVLFVYRSVVINDRKAALLRRRRCLYPENGLTMARPFIRRPACRSSVSNWSHPAWSAAATIKAS